MKPLIISSFLIFYLNLHTSLFADNLPTSNNAILAPKEAFFNGYQAHQSNNWGSAVSFFEQVPDNYILYDYALYYKASALSNLMKYDEALLYFNKIIKEYPASPLISFTILNMGDISLSAGRYEAAVQYFNMFITRFPSHNEIPKALYKSAISFDYMNRKEESQGILKRLYIEYPINIYAQIIPEPVLSEDELYNRIQNLFNARQYKRVIKESSISKEERFLMPYAKSLYHAKDYNEAIKTFRTALENTANNKNREEVFLWLGKAYSNLNQDEDAIKIYKESMNRFPNGVYTDEIIYRTSIISKESGAESYALELLNKLANTSSSKWKDDALWQLAWIYYGKRDYKNAERYLALLTGSKTDRFKKQSMYWYGRVMDKLGSSDKAADTFKKLYTQETLPSYYGTMARKRLEEMDILTKHGAANYSQANPFTKINTSDANGLFTRTKELISINLSDLAYLELETISMNGRSFDDFIQAGILFKEIGKLGRTRYIGNYLIQNPMIKPENELFQTALYLAYPVGYKTIVDTTSASSLIDPYLVYALITQESGFNEEIVSRAGAIGLMQIMPKTGLEVAETLSIEGFKVDNLFSADVNVAIGTTYLKEVLKEFKDNIHHALAAYNAGPHIVKAWLKKYNNTDTDEFVENIPYRETRNYVKQVVSAYEIYRYIYNGSRL